LLPTAVIGLGYWGPNLARNFSASPSTDLVGLFDLDKARLEGIGDLYPAARRFETAAEVFASPDVAAVAIATPVSSHDSLAKQALEAGKHVLVEKPLADSSAKAVDLVMTAERMGRVLMVDHVFVYSPAVRRLKEIVDSEEFGDVRYVDSVRINLGLLQHDVNVMWDLGPHDLSIMDLLIGRGPRSVIAVGASHAAGEQVEMAYLHLDYGEGLTASAHLNWLSPVKVRHLLVGGTNRSVLYNDLDRSEPVKAYDRGVSVEPDPEGRRSLLVSYRSGDVISPRVSTQEPLSAMIEHFAECVATGAEPMSGGTQGLRVVQTLEAADESLKLGGKRVEMS